MVLQAVTGLSSEYPAGHSAGWHTHDRSQVVYAISGVLTVSTDNGIWIVPPQRAVWVPANRMHEVEMTRDVSMRSLYIAPDVKTDLPDHNIVLQMSPLMRELLLKFFELPRPYDTAGSGGRLVQVMIDQLATLQTEPLHQPLAAEPRLEKILSAFYENPAIQHELSWWAR